MEAVDRERIEAIVQAVAELPDRTSPDDWPEAMLVTADELRGIVRTHLAEALTACRQERRSLASRFAHLEGVRLPHARLQENANGFQRGWHAALSRVREGDTADDLSALVPEPSATVEIPVCQAEAALTACRAQGEAMREKLAQAEAEIMDYKIACANVQVKLDAILAALSSTHKEGGG